MSLLSLLGGASGSPITTVAPQGVDLDGANDYFSRSSDLTGNVDSKTFTFSAWLYLADTTINGRIFQSGNNRISFYIGSSNLVFYVADTAGATALSVSIPITRSSGAFTFHHILASFDMANNVGSKIYLDDILQTRTTSTFINTTLDFTDTQFTIGSYSDFSQKFKGRLSNLFFDYTYRDLSIEANRRLFIDGNGKPADGWKALSPIIGMSMKDAATAHINDYGTGGNFTPNGTYATSNRGANQDNCVASYFDGVADYLSRTSLTGIADGKQFVASFCVNLANTTAPILSFDDGTSTTTNQGLQVYYSTSDVIVIGRNVAGTTILQISFPTSELLIQRKTNHVCLSVDLSNSSNRSMIVNGKIVSPTWTTYINDTIDLTKTRYAIGTRLNNAVFFGGNLGELYFNTAYIDLSTSNPFWDSTTNRPVPVRKVITNTGVAPLIAMPLDASNAGKNYGTGGDFTLYG